MTTLQRVWADAWRKRKGLGDGWIVNLEPVYNLALGAVGVVDGDDFAAETTLELRGVIGLAEDPNQHRQPVPWQFQSNDGISVKLSSDGAVAGPSGAPPPAAWTLNASFGAGEGVSVYGSSQWWRGYADLGIVREALIRAGREGRLHKGESIVVTQHLSGAGLLLTAEGKNASLIAQATAQVAPGATPPIASLSAGLNVTSSSGGAQVQSFADGAVLSARLLYLGKRGFLWWRDFVALGAVELNPDELEDQIMTPVEGDGSDEYFALI